MRTTTIAFITLLAFGRLSAQPNPAAQSVATEAPKTAELQGTVLSSSGEPIANATLRLQNIARPEAGPRAYSTSTDDAGSFHFQDVTPGSYFLSAERPGYVRKVLGQHGMSALGALLNLRPGERREQISIVLEPYAVISGTVTNADGDPVVGAFVSPLDPARSAGGRRLTQVTGPRPAATDDRGEYRIIGVPPGRHYLQAALPNRIGPYEVRADGEDPVPEDLRTFYPKTPDPNAAVPITVNAGDELTGVDIELARELRYSASGAVTGNIPDQPTFVRFGRYDDPLPFPQHRISEGENRFILDGLPPGRYHGTVSSLEQTRHGTFDFTIDDESLTDLVLPLSAGAAIAGQVQLEDGDISTYTPAQPPRDENGELAFVNAAPRVIVRQVQDSSILPGQSEAYGTAMVDTDGSFSIPNLPSVGYRLEFFGWDPKLYIKSANLNGQDVTHSTMNLTSGAGGTLNILLSDRAAQFTAMVTDEDGNPISAADVTLWPRSTDPAKIQREFVTVRTDAQEQAQFPNLPPGDYYLSAFYLDDPSLARIPAFLTQCQDDAEKLELSESAQVTLQVEPISDASIARALQNMP